ncbi:MAG: pilus assembly protein [Xanthomonadaceae bacterium]|nr:pilus assembly protein [Xanthomonadaceae bacterium]
MKTFQRMHLGGRRQQGISLLVVLILLVVMSILGVAVMRSSSMQERMAANLRDRSLATQAAETALAAGQTYLNANTKWRSTTPTAATCTNEGVCPTFTDTGSATWVTGPTVGGANGVPQTTTDYWIEYLGENQTVMETGGVIPSSETVTLGPMFRITARSRAVGRAAVTLQTDVIYRFQRL